MRWEVIISAVLCGDVWGAEITHNKREYCMAVDGMHTIQGQKEVWGHYRRHSCIALAVRWMKPYQSTLARSSVQICVWRHQGCWINPRTAGYINPADLLWPRPRCLTFTCAMWPSAAPEQWPIGRKINQLNLGKHKLLEHFDSGAFLQEKCE